MQQLGQFLEDRYTDLSGGLNLSDSPFKVKSNCCVSGVNWQYTQTGAARKRKGHPKLNSSADTELKTLGLSMHKTASGTRTNIRAAGTRIQNLDTSTPSFTNLTEDTASAGSSFLSSSSNQPVVFSQFNATSADTLWLAGGGLSTLYGVYSASKVTANGSASPTGAITATRAGAGGGTFAATGTYFYAVALRKRSTQALSNCALDVSATISATTDKVTISLSGLTSLDATKYDKVYLYRSAVGGVTAFTTGDLVAQIDVATTSYDDTGTYISTAQNIPRAGNTLLDNSVLPTGTITTVTTFKRRLVTAINSTLYFSDLNKPESWPSGNTIAVPSGGPITGLAIISFTSTGSNTIDEILVVFKEREVWVVTGTSISDWSLKYIDAIGAANQALIVTANGRLTWIDYRGVFLWDGTGKPIYCSRLIEPLFAQDGDLDKTKLTYGVGRLYGKQNLVVWSLSHKIYGTQKLQLKLDLRLTLPQIQNGLSGGILDGVFLMDATAFSVYALDSYLGSNGEEHLLYGDDSGFIYDAFTNESDAGAAFSFKYKTPQLFQGNPEQDKRYNYVVVWVDDLGTWNLTLDWWTNFTTAEGVKSTRAQAISTSDTSAVALWDIAFWDTAYWDDYSAKPRPLFFQLASDASNNNEGKAIQLQFRQDGASQPVTIIGFSIVYSEKGMNK